MGQSLGLCLLRLIPVLQLPHRGLLAAAACAWSGSAPVRGLRSLAEVSHPAGRAEGLLPSLFCSSGYMVPQKKVATLQNTATRPTQSRPIMVMATSHPHRQWLQVSEH